MPFVVEDGTGLAAANSFASVEDARVYADERGIEGLLCITDTLTEQALVKGTDHIVVRWGYHFSGARLSSTQALPFPRTGVTTRDGTRVSGVPREIKFATIEYARRALELADLMPDPPPAFAVRKLDGTTLNPASGSSSQQVRQRRRTVGPITIIDQFSDQTAAAVQTAGGSRLVAAVNIPAYPMADALVELFLDQSASGQLQFAERY